MPGRVAGRADVTLTDGGHRGELRDTVDRGGGAAELARDALFQYGENGATACRTCSRTRAILQLAQVQPSAPSSRHSGDTSDDPSGTRSL